jgi:uncharacterized protein (TIGR03435 family)
MKALIRWIFVVAMLLNGTVHAQSLAGQWQGTLQAGKELRVVLVVSSADGGGLRAMMHLIDQSGQGIPASSVTQRGATVQVTFQGLGVTLDGTVSSDGNGITGTFSQAGKPLPITLARATPDTAWAIPELPKPMAADAPATFEVATIKPSDPNAQGKLFTVKGRLVLTINTSLSDLMTFAYGVHAQQIVGGPPWMQTDRYDVTGQPEAPGVPNQDQLRAMIRGLMADRFKLAFHRETRELSVYAIVVRGGGPPKLTRNDSNPKGLPSLLFRGLGVLPAMNATMGDLAGVLQTAVLDRPVVDRTGLEGRYDFTLTWTPDETQFAGLGVRVPPPSGDPNAPPGLFTAFQEQLGLRLDSTRAPAEVLVIDRVERPSEN